MPIDTSLKFVPINIAILTISDTRTINTDTSGALLEERINSAGHKCIEKQIIPDDVKLIRETLQTLSSKEEIDCIITTGGTGLTGRDTTPEAVIEIADKIIEGFGELFRQLSYEEIATSTIQSRVTAGVANGTYIFCLPGSTGACRTGWDKILAAQLDLRNKPCNFAELIPRLKER